MVGIQERRAPEEAGMTADRLLTKVFIKKKKKLIR